MKQDLLKKVFFASALLMLLSMLFLTKDFGITGDEPDMNEYGKAVLNYYTSIGKDTTVFNMPKLHNRDGVAQYYGGLFDLIAATVNKVSPFSEYDTRHALNALFGFIAIFFTGLVAAQIGGWRMGLISLWIIFLSPRFFGHSMNNPKDIPFATATIFTIWAIIKLLNTMPKLSWQHIIIVSLGIAAAINVRVGGILLIGYLGLFMLVEAWHIDKSIGNIFSGKNLKSYLITGVVTALFGYIGGSILWPFALQNPISNPLKALEVMGNFKVNIRQLYAGEQVFSTDLPSSYLTNYISITTPLLLLLGLGLASILYWLNKHEFNGRRVLFIAFTAIFPIAYIIYTKANVYHEFRHVQFAYPSIVVMAAFGWELLLRYAKKPVLKYTVIGSFTLLALLPAKFMFANHPYQYLYYNELQGGLEAANGEYVTDYWMQSMNEGCDWLIKNAKPKPDGSKIIIGTTAPVQVGIYLKEHLDRFEVRYVKFPQRHEKEWDYALFYADYINPRLLKNSYAWPLDQTVHNIKTNNITIGVVVKRPDNSDYLGLKSFNEQKVPEARQYLEKAIQQYPNSDVINFYLGYIYYAYQDRQNASLYLTRAAQINPDFAQQANQILSAMK